MDTAAFLAFVRSLSAIERSALLDALSSYTERADGEPKPAHHAFLEGLQAIVEDEILGRS
jgi:hypothetical protein